ncbi:phytoene/squalene synthase family protein [Limibacillus halophilus]
MPETTSLKYAYAKADLARCRAIIREGSKSFHAASLLLPGSLRQSCCVLYAFCRLSDDAVDRESGGLVAVEQLRARLARAYAGEPEPLAVERALAALLRNHMMPPALPEALLEGLRWDAEGRRYQSFSEVIDYSVRVAGAVGAMMSLIMGRRDPDVLARAIDLGVAMQLTNIARDVGEDARNGRLYLPLDWFEEAGMDPEAWLAAPQFDSSIAAMVKRLLTEAGRLYDRSLPGISALPALCRPGIHAARLIYSEIGRDLERHDLDSLERRAYVTGRRKLTLILRAGLMSLVGGYARDPARLAEGEYLLTAVAEAPELPPELWREPWWDLDGKAERVVDLLSRLERRDQTRLAGAPRR